MSKGKKIVVVGSSNTDLVVKSAHLPKPGETVLGGEFQMVPGGKGANQAVAASRLGAEVNFIAKFGTDSFGKEAIKGLEAQGLNTSFASFDEQTASGVALIMVDDQGENCISVASGTNALLTPNDIENASPAFKDAACLLVQLETPMETVSRAIEFAVEHQCEAILNPAPATQIPDDILTKLDWITPNESEAEILTGIVVNDLLSAQTASSALKAKGVKSVIITMGPQGAYVDSAAFQGLVPSRKVKAIDTTAAGDTFNGALAVALSQNKPIEEAVGFANAAAAYSVTQFGAQSSAPRPTDLLYFKPV